MDFIILNVLSCDHIYIDVELKLRDSRSCQESLRVLCKKNLIMYLCDTEIQLRYQDNFKTVCLVFMYIYSHMSAKIVVQLLFCNKYIFGHKQCSTLSA